MKFAMSIIDLGVNIYFDEEFKNLLSKDGVKTHIWVLKKDILALAPLQQLKIYTTKPSGNQNAFISAPVTKDKRMEKFSPDGMSGRDGIIYRVLLPARLWKSVPAAPVTDFRFGKTYVNSSKMFAADTDPFSSPYVFVIVPRSVDLPKYTRRKKQKPKVRFQGGVIMNPTPPPQEPTLASKPWRFDSSPILEEVEHDAREAASRIEREVELDREVRKSLIIAKNTLNEALAVAYRRGWDVGVGSAGGGEDLPREVVISLSVTKTENL